MCEKVGSIGTFVKDLAKKRFTLRQGIYSNNKKPVVEDSIICYHNEPKDRKMTGKEMKCSHEETFGLYGSVKKKNFM